MRAGKARGCSAPTRPEAEPWTIVMPPPNVTGSLHIGHALDITLQDILTRHARLQGKDALWVVGTDHAGIATQMVVERQLERAPAEAHRFQPRGVHRQGLGVEGGERRRDHRASSAGSARRCDWANERFTMDEGFSSAVLKVFVDLYHQRPALSRQAPGELGSGPQDRDLRPRGRDHARSQGKFWHFRYPLEDGSRRRSRSRPPGPRRCSPTWRSRCIPRTSATRALVGKKVRLPITGRLIPIIADEHADPELGSGAVKITPGHDFNDFEVGKRAGFKPAEMLNMLDGEARVVQTADGLIPAELLGLDRFEARKRVVELIEAEGLLEKVEDRMIATPFGDRSGVVIEPWLTDQWYVDAATLAKPAIEAVRSGDIRVVPETWKKTWFNWLENIQPWCVSRQLWWGHRIPAWYDEAGNVYVAETEAEAQAQAGQGVALRRDPDVLDTWFSSALWPFATLGWPERDRDAASAIIPTTC